MRRAVIIGAGIGGVAAGIALAARGWQVTLSEQAPALTEVGAGLQLGPNAVAVLDALGVGDELRAAAAEPNRVEMRDDRTGALIAQVTLGDDVVARHGRPYLQLHRADLLQVLLHAAERAGVRLAFGTRVEDLQSVAEADLVVAADGIKSAAREQIAGRSSPQFLGHVAWRALAAADRVPGLDTSATLLCLGPGRHLVAYPLRGGAIWNVVAVTEETTWAGEGWNEAGDPSALHHAFRDADGPLAALLDAADAPLRWGLFGHAPLPRWTLGRCALLGDAAHPMLPFLAQGAAMAIEDAWVLAACLQDRSVEEGLARYARIRRPRVGRVQRTAARNAHIYHAKGARAAVIRFGIRAAARLPGGLLAGLDWLYGEDVTAGPP
ncbi:MAG: FAD-dependent monooxygenase [Pseudomonadota bacterium]